MKTNVIPFMWDGDIYFTDGEGNWWDQMMKEISKGVSTIEYVWLNRPDADTIKSQPDVTEMYLKRASILQEAFKQFNDDKKAIPL